MQPHNKHPKHIQDKIIKLKQKGKKSREIASQLGISKSSVNYTYNRWLGVYDKPEIAVVEATKNVLFIDIECAPDIAATFKRFNANFGQDNILQDGGWLISIAWRWMHEDKAQGIALVPDEALKADDKRLVAVLFGLIEKADVIVGHNIDRFDFPVIKSRIVINKFAPLKKVKTIDTLKMAKQMKFQSNRLGSLGVILGEGDKASHSGISTWIGCMSGKQEALNEMLVYNIEDVDLLWRVYHRLIAHSSRTVNMGLFAGTVVCPNCGSEAVERTGNLVYTVSQAYDEYECNDCGARSRGTEIQKKAIKLRQ